VKYSVLNAPTYSCELLYTCASCTRDAQCAVYRRGVLLDTFAGAVPARLMELLSKHRGNRTSTPWKLVSVGIVRATLPSRGSID